MRRFSFLVIVALIFISALRAEPTTVEIRGNSRDSITYQGRDDQPQSFQIFSESGLPAQVSVDDRGAEGLEISVALGDYIAAFDAAVDSVDLRHVDATTYKLFIPPTVSTTGRVVIRVGLDSGLLPYVEIGPESKEAFHRIESALELRNLERYKRVLALRGENALKAAEQEIADMNERRLYESCFYKGTCILIPGNSKPIEAVALGDIVLGYDHKKNMVIETVVRALRWGFNRVSIKAQADTFKVPFEAVNFGVQVVPSHTFFHIEDGSENSELPQGSYKPLARALIQPGSGDLPLVLTSSSILDRDDLQARGGIFKARTSLWKQPLFDRASGVELARGFYSDDASPVFNFTTRTENYFCTSAIAALGDHTKVLPGMLAHNIKVFM